MPFDMTAARLRALIAAATPAPWALDVHYREVKGGMEVTISIPELSRPQTLTSKQLADWESQLPNLRLVEFVVNHAPAMADALGAKELLETLMSHILSVRRDNTDEWMEGLVETLNATEMAIGGKDHCEYLRRDGVIRVLRAAKEAAQST